MLPSKDPSESVVVKFDFSGELLSVDQAQVSVSAYRGTDPNPASILLGSPQLDGPAVLQRIQGGLSGVSYNLRCIGQGGADVIVRSDLLPVKTRVF